MNKIKILMCSKPGGDRGPAVGYREHIKAINLLGKDFNIYCDELNENTNLSEYDAFWFYVRFDPRIYYFIKKNFPNKKIIVGANVLLEKPEIGLSDEWEKWFVENVNFDMYFNAVEFYGNHVKKFFKPELKEKATFLDHCLDLRFLDNKPVKKVSLDDPVLIYSKNRRIDKDYFNFFSNLIDELQENDIEYKVIEYGNYKREEYYSMIKNSSCVVTTSIEDYPGYAMYEAMYLNRPVIGTQYNIPNIFSKDFWVDCQNLDDSWITRKDGAAKLYVSKIKNYLNGKLEQRISPREYVENKTSYKTYLEELSKRFELVGIR